MSKSEEDGVGIMTNRAFIGLGSNQKSAWGDPTETLLAAAQRIGMLEGVCFVQLSSFYTSEPALYADQPLFTNAVLEIKTSLPASELLEALQAVELEFGRERSIKNGPRTLDCDLLDYEGVVCSMPALTLPHPGILKRDFVVTPLLEIAPRHVLANDIPVTRELISCGAIVTPKTTKEVSEKKATFSVCATPIGNLGDVTLRVLAALRVAHVIYAEDTRVTRKLLMRYDIRTRVERCDENVLERKLPQLLARLEAGEHVAYVTDAGMPGISDPGMALVDAVRNAGHVVEVLPGASAAITALVASGFLAQGFYFGGFLPRTEAARKSRLEALRALTNTVLVFYESPHRVIASLEALEQVLPTDKVCIARELTKLHEETLFGAPGELLSLLKTRMDTRGPLKGEVVLVVAPPDLSRALPQGASCRQDQVEQTNLQEEIKVRAAELLAQKNLQRSQMAKMLVKEFGISREQAYQAAGAGDDSIDTR